MFFLWQRYFSYSFILLLFLWIYLIWIWKLSSYINICGHYIIAALPFDSSWFCSDVRISVTEAWEAQADAVIDTHTHTHTPDSKLQWPTRADRWRCDKARMCEVWLRRHTNDQEPRSSLRPDKSLTWTSCLVHRWRYTGDTHTHTLILLLYYLICQSNR